MLTIMLLLIKRAPSNLPTYLITYRHWHVYYTPHIHVEQKIINTKFKPLLETCNSIEFLEQLGLLQRSTNAQQHFQQTASNQIILPSCLWWFTLMDSVV